MKRWACISPKHMFASARDNRIVDLSPPRNILRPIKIGVLGVPAGTIARAIDMVESNLSVILHHLA